MTHSVLIIGAGKIAQGFDNPKDEKISTHVKAYLNFPNKFKVKAICDTDKKLADEAAKKWNIENVYYNYDEIKIKNYDVVSICTPDHTHGYFLKKILLNKPKVIFLEKPMGLNYQDSVDIFKECEKNNILLLLNYSRIYIKEFSKIKDNFKSNKLLSVDLKYHKGFDHTCSHLINLFFYMFEAELINYTINDKFIDYDENDPTISGTFNFKNHSNEEFRLNIQGYKESDLNIIEMDIISSKYRIRYSESKGSKVTEYNLCSYDMGIVLKEFVKNKSYELNYNNSFINSMGIIIKFLNQEKIDNINDIQKSFLSTVKFINKIKNHE